MSDDSSVESERAWERQQRKMEKHRKISWFFFRVSVSALIVGLLLRFTIGCAPVGCQGEILTEDRAGLCDDLAIYEAYRKYPRLPSGHMSWELIAIRQQYQHAVLMSCILGKKQLTKGENNVGK